MIVNITFESKQSETTRVKDFPPTPCSKYNSAIYECSDGGAGGGIIVKTHDDDQPCQR